MHLVTYRYIEALKVCLLLIVPPPGCAEFGTLFVSLFHMNLLKKFLKARITTRDS